MMADIQYELIFLEAAASELKSYLFSDDVYWHLGLRSPGGARPYPQFSLGWLLLFRKRLAGSENERAQEVLRQIAETENRWKSNWAIKAEKEFVQRLKLWAQYMNEVREFPDGNRERFAYEVQRRTMLELLAEDAGTLPKELAQLLRTIDAALRGMLKPGPFIEDAGFEAQFPEERFWFLYGSLG